jgi:hypothetical protein
MIPTGFGDSKRTRYSCNWICSAPSTENCDGVRCRGASILARSRYAVTGSCRLIEIR